MQEKGFDQLPVTNGAKKKLVGLLTLGMLEDSFLFNLTSSGHVLAKVASGRADLNSPVSSVMFSFSGETPKSPSKGKKKKPVFVEITEETALESLSSFFEQHASAIVTEKDTETKELIVKHVVTKVDLLGWLMKSQLKV